MVMDVYKGCGEVRQNERMGCFATFHSNQNAFAHQKRKQRMCGHLRLKSRGMLGI